MVGKPHEHDKRITLASAGDKSLFEKVLNAAKKAYTYLYSVGKYNAKDISEYTELINATNDVFSNALKKGIKDNVIPARMMTSLESDVFVFSALKTHAQLFEASRQLLTDDGKVKSFQQFSQDIAKIEKDYNQAYLQAEYNFAVSSAQQAANWAKIEENKGRYNLQYRTANDDRVRDSHAVLDGITLPADDTFWNSYYPPNGWNCRCVAVEVLKDKYPESDSEASIKKGDKATTQLGKDGKNRMEIFRFNPGKEKVIFPPNHPYNKLQGADALKKGLELKIQRKSVLTYAKENIVGTTVKHNKFEKPIQFTVKGIKEAINQPHEYIREKNIVILQADEYIKEAKFIKSAISTKNDREKMHYLEIEIKKKPSYIVIKENLNTKEISFYSIVDKLK